MKITLSHHILAAGIAENESALDFVIEHKNQVQVSRTLRSPFARIFNRGNQVTTLRFRVRRTHPTPEAAMLFALKHGKTIGDAEGALVCEVEDAMDVGSFVYTQATLVQEKTTPQGNITESRYIIEAGEV